MAKQRSGQLSVKKRREEMRRKQAQQNRMIMIGGGVLAVIVLALIAWMIIRATTAGSDETATGETLTGDRPLAALAPAERNNYYSEYPPMIIDPEKEYEAVIKLAKGGEMRLELFPREAPLTVNSFVFLATQGFYDGVTFHRVLPNFMAQGGDPTGSGSGGPGYQFVNETTDNLTFDKRGVLAMANAGPDTNGSQFFITFGPSPNLNGGYTIFGQLLEGDDVLSSISLRDPNQAPTTPGDTIERIDIVER